jgi:HSP20 family protein
MAIIRWQPAREIGSFQSDVNRLFATIFDTPTGAQRAAVARRWVPATDLVEHADRYELRADLPGIGEEDVNVELDGNVLTISGERKFEHDEQHDGYRRIERSYGSFSRSLTLPDGIDADAVQASFEHGVLEISVPKPEQRKSRRVTIAAGAKPAALDDEERGEGAEQGESEERAGS